MRKKEITVCLSRGGDKINRIIAQNSAWLNLFSWMEETRVEEEPLETLMNTLAPLKGYE
jgi:hypothetical protein